MGQAKRRGTFEQRKAESIALAEQMDTEAKEALEKWIASLTPEQKEALEKQKHDRAQLAGAIHAFTNGLI